MNENKENSIFVGAIGGEVAIRFENTEIIMSRREAEILAFGLMEMSDEAGKQ